jgi:hypothetical protein
MYFHFQQVKIFQASMMPNGFGVEISNEFGHGLSFLKHKCRKGTCTVSRQCECDGESSISNGWESSSGIRDTQTALDP